MAYGTDGVPNASWPIRTIAECASSEPYSTQIGPFGKALTPEAYVPSGVPLLRGVNVNSGRFHDDDFVFISEEDADRLSKFESFPGDVLLVHKGSLGHIGLMPAKRRFRRYIMGNSMLRVRCDPDKLLPEYLHYWLRSPAGQHYLLSRVSQVGVPQIQRPLTTLREAALPVPPLDEQRAIAGVLGALDDKIEQNRRTARALERLARAIFRAWFVDFEPVKAKAAGATSFPSMPQPAFDSLPTRLVESEIGLIPEGWEVGTVADMADLSKAQVKPQDHRDEIFEHYSIPAFDAGQNPVEEPGSAIKSNKFLVVDGCVLLSKLNPRIPRVWLPPSPNGRRQIASTEFLILTPRDGWDRHYLYCQFQQTEFRDDLAQGASGTSNSHQRVRPGDLLSKRVVVGPEWIRTAFGEIAAPLFAALASGHSESGILASVRDVLLPKLLSGAVRIGAEEVPA